MRWRWRSGGAVWGMPSCSAPPRRLMWSMPRRASSSWMWTSCATFSRLSSSQANEPYAGREYPCNALRAPRIPEPALSTWTTRSSARASRRCPPRQRMCPRRLLRSRHRRRCPTHERSGTDIEFEAFTTLLLRLPAVHEQECGLSLSRRRQPGSLGETVALTSAYCREHAAVLGQRALVGLQQWLGRLPPGRVLRSCQRQV